MHKLHTCQHVEGDPPRVRIELACVWCRFPMRTVHILPRAVNWHIVRDGRMDGEPFESLTELAHHSPALDVKRDSIVSPKGMRLSIVAALKLFAWNNSQGRHV